MVSFASTCSKVWNYFTSVPSINLHVCIAFQIQDMAIRCIQKNIKKNRGVKGWPWWKVFTTVRPLIEVQLTEEQIRGKDVSMHLLSSHTFLTLSLSLPPRLPVLTNIFKFSKSACHVQVLPFDNTTAKFKAHLLGFLMFPVFLPQGSLSNSASALGRTQYARLFDYCLCGFDSIRVFVKSRVFVCAQSGRAVCLHTLPM